MIEQAEEQDGSGQDVLQGQGFFILNLLQVGRIVQQDVGAKEVRVCLVLVD